MNSEECDEKIEKLMLIPEPYKGYPHWEVPLGEALFTMRGVVVFQEQKIDELEEEIANIVKNLKVD